MKRLFLMIFTLLVCAPVFAQSQTLPSTFKYEKKPTEDGSYLYSLSPVVEEIYKKYGGSSPYQIAGAVVRLDTQKAVIVFANAQTKFQLATQSDKSVSILADNYKIEDLEYDLAAKTDGDTLIKLEIGNSLLKYKDFEKVMNADSVTLKYGAVTYKLDSDNIKAFHYLAAQIKKDTKSNDGGGAPG